ncbi:MAG: SH3 domain-containing protein [Aggregatilineales bacterium]
MGLLFIAAGAIFALLFIINNLSKTLLRRQTVGRVDILLAFLATLIAVCGLTLEQLSDTPDWIVQRGTLILALVLALSNLIIIALEWFRPQRLRGSRGLLGLTSGLLLAISTFTVPFAATYLSIATFDSRDNPSEGEAAPSSSVVNEVPEARAEQLFQAIRVVLAEEISANEVEVFTQLDAGTPLAEIIRANGGDIDRVVRRIAEIMREGVRESIARGEVNALQAALFLSQMEPIVRLAINSNLTEIGGRFGPTPTGTRASLLDLLTQVPAATPMAASTEIPSTSPPPTATNTPTLRPTNTPRPSVTPTAERTRFATRTPTPTPTTVTPCLASVEYNLRLRAQPNFEAETLLVIPYTTMITLSARSADSAWWLTEYDGQTGWVAGEFLTLSAGCAALPAR